MPAPGGRLCVVDSEKSKSHFGWGHLEEPVLRAEAPYCAPVKCIFVLVALAMAFSACCYLKCGFLDLGLTLKLYSKYPNFIFLRVA